jgi:DNA polymerase III epsilon subunit-like protein
MKARVETTQAKMLVWDLENRPLSYWYDGRPTAEVTAIGWKWVGETDCYVAAMGAGTQKTADKLLRRFRPAYEKADVLIGHNIRSHDLPILNAICVEYNLPPLQPKLTIDTLRDLQKFKDIPKSLEYLCDLLDCPHPKFHMTQHSWRQANRLEAQGLKLSQERVRVDVRATELVYQELLKLGLIVKPPKMWTPN